MASSALDQTTSALFVFLVCFWIALFVISGMVHIPMSPNNTGQINNGFDITNLIKIMSFQLSDSINPLVSLFLDGIFIFSVLIGILFLKTISPV